MVQEVLTVAPGKLNNFEALTKKFFTEHLHEQEEIRFILDGIGTTTTTTTTTTLISSPKWRQLIALWNRSPAETANLYGPLVIHGPADEFDNLSSPLKSIVIVVQDTKTCETWMDNGSASRSRKGIWLYYHQECTTASPLTTTTISR